jgi:hypothetical protein
MLNFNSPQGQAYSWQLSPRIQAVLSIIEPALLAEAAKQRILSVLAPN